MAGICECGNEPSNEPSFSIKGSELLDQLNDHKLLNNDYAPWS